MLESVEDGRRGIVLITIRKRQFDIGDQLAKLDVQIALPPEAYTKSCIVSHTDPSLQHVYLHRPITNTTSKSESDVFDIVGNTSPCSTISSYKELVIHKCLRRCARPR